ncbi:MAG: BrxA/BrxB family bacilliredoxin [Bacteroidia bacterium]|nr:BrxA/BrxB family bacilliredoxin [Bacteroidia bacterium]MDW8159124.1 BrxA/BrxB family bacilliredoxin [Bacteroidia bacterium]
MYPLQLIAPMKAELTDIGFQELKTPEEVDQALSSQKGTLLLVINSVCGCAAGAARPGVKLALQHKNRPNFLFTVFAGVDKEATQRARQYLLPYPPSSPSIALFKDGNLVHFLERHHIEGKSASMIAQNLMLAFDQYCNLEKVEV